MARNRFREMQAFLLGAPAVLVALAAAGAPAWGADEAAAGRKVVRAWQDAVVTVRLVLSTRVVMQGREVSKSESTSVAAATVIDPSGLAVLSFSETDPTEAFRRMELGGEDKFKFSMDSEMTDLKMRLSDGTEVPAEIVLRDKDLDLAFVRPSEPLEEPIPAVDLKKSAGLGVLDAVVLLGRLGKVASWAPSVTLDRVQAVMEKPRTFYIPGAAAGNGQLGTPAFSLDGKIAGVLLLRRPPFGGGGFSAFQGPHMKELRVILPSEDILEAAEQVPARKKKGKGAAK
jgi:S1-C subfamily serine protease